MTPQQISLSVVTYLFLILSIVLTLLRCYTRFVVLKSGGLDDVISILGMLSLTGFLVIVLRGIQHGFGVHITDLDLPTLVDGSMYAILTRPLFSITTAIIKLSIGVMLLRLVNHKRRNVYLIYLTIAVNMIMSISTFFITLFQCKPIAYSWRQAIPTEKGTCLDSKAIVTIGYVYSVESIVLDLFYAILPAFIFWGLQMKKDEKIVLVFLMSLGLFASVATIIRFRFLIGIVDATDPLFALAPAMIWSIVELGLAQCIACLITLRPFLRHVGIRFTTSSATDPVSNPPTSRPTYPTYHGYELDDASQGRQSNSSKEQILGDSDIRKQTRIVMTTH